MPTIILNVILVALTIHLVSAVLNYGITYACLQRSDMRNARKNKRKHILRCLLYALPGIFTLLPNLSVSNFPKYGLKFWPTEELWISKKWALEEAMNGTEIPEHKIGKDSGSGRCASIW